MGNPTRSLSEEPQPARPTHRKMRKIATVQINQVLLRAVPSDVTQQRFTGFDSSGLVRYGPETRDKAAVIELENVSTAVVRLQIEYLQGETVIGLGSVALELTPGETVEVNDPPFQDVVSALNSYQSIKRRAHCRHRRGHRRLSSLSHSRSHGSLRLRG